MDKYTIELTKHGNVVQRIPSASDDIGEVARTAEDALSRSAGAGDDWQIVDGIRTTVMTRDRYLKMPW